MQIFVRTSDGAQHAVDIPHDATAQDIIEVVGLSNDMTLLFEGRPLRPRQPLAEAGVCAEAQLQISKAKCMVNRQ